MELPLLFNLEQKGANVLAGWSSILVLTVDFLRLTSTRFFTVCMVESSSLFG